MLETGGLPFFGAPSEQGLRCLGGLEADPGRVQKCLRLAEPGVKFRD